MFEFFFLFRAIPPPIIWAQRSGVVFVTINVEDCKDPDIKIEEDKFYFKSVGGVEKKLYEVTVPLYKEIDPEVSYLFRIMKLMIKLFPITALMKEEVLLFMIFSHLQRYRGFCAVMLKVPSLPVFQIGYSVFHVAAIA